MKTKLFITNKSPYSTKRYDTLIKLLDVHLSKENKIGLALIEDAVTLLTGRLTEKIMNLVDKGLKLYVLKEDVEARGLASIMPTKNVQVVDYHKLIKLVMEEYSQIINFN